MPNPIAILGDFNPAFSTHVALAESLEHLHRIVPDAAFEWVATDEIKPDYPTTYSGLWIAPGSPYRDMHNVLHAITIAREHQVPTLGNCGGFQHMLIEYARNVCGMTHADHEETNPNTEHPLISRLSCSLVGEEEHVQITDHQSILYRLLASDQLVGRYYCRYGLNPEHVDRLAGCGLTFTAKSTTGEIRGFELRSHPFYLGTLFQPALTSAADEPNPILVGFAKACVRS